MIVGRTEELCSQNTATYHSSTWREHAPHSELYIPRAHGCNISNIKWRRTQILWIDFGSFWAQTLEHFSYSSPAILKRWRLLRQQVYSGSRSSPSSSSPNSSSTSSRRRAAVLGRSICGPSGSWYDASVSTQSYSACVKSVDKFAWIACRVHVHSTQCSIDMRVHET